MALTDAQRLAYRFLRARAQDGEKFSAADIERVAGWKSGSFKTYKTKHLKEYVTTVGSGKYTVGPYFLRITEDDFSEIVSQSRRTVARFGRTVFDAVLRYEFLLPLTNERKLRAALDELFYRDQLVQRATELGKATLVTIVPVLASESDNDYMRRVANMVGSLLGGYSIGHVHGRFRAGGLRTHAEAAEILAARGRYLVDETTAVVRFLLPLAGSRKSHGRQFDISAGKPVDASAFMAEADTARSLFIAFFVESVILDIHGEDEIWFLESGPGGERLYVLERDSAATATTSKAKTTTKASRRSAAGSPQLALDIQMNPAEAWLSANGYDDTAKQIQTIVSTWRSAKLKTRRNWWDVLAGDKQGRPREVAGVEFPVIAAIRKRQGLHPVPGAISKPGEKAPPPME